MVGLENLNPFATIGISKIGLVLLVFFLAIFVCGLIGFGVWFWMNKKQLKYTLPLYKMVGSRPFKIATYKARDFKIGMAGDKLWYIPRLKKYIQCGTIQDAPNEYPHFEREDGEWINFALCDIDEEMKTAGVKYVNADMRSNRIAIGDLLEARFKDKKSWWERYGHLVTHVIFYLIVMIAMVVVFYQWSIILDKTNTFLDRLLAIEERLNGQQKGVVPALIPLLIWRFKKWMQ